MACICSSSSFSAYSSCSSCSRMTSCSTAVVVNSFWRMGSLTYCCRALDLPVWSSSSFWSSIYTWSLSLWFSECSGCSPMLFWLLFSMMSSISSIGNWSSLFRLSISYCCCWSVILILLLRCTRNESRLWSRMLSSCCCSLSRNESRRSTTSSLGGVVWSSC